MGHGVVGHGVMGHGVVCVWVCVGDVSRKC